MDLGRALGYPFRDENWIVKILIGAIVSLIPIVNFIGTGYALRVTREVLRDNEDTMPEWDDFGGDFIKGLLVTIGGILYFLPMSIPVLCATFATVAVSGNGDGGGIVFVVFCCLFPFTFGYSIIAGSMLAAATAHYAATDDFRTAFLDFGGRFRDVRDHLGETAMLILFILLVGIISAVGFSMTIWLCGLGLAFVWSNTLVTAHLTAQYGQVIGIDPIAQNRVGAFA